MRTLMQLHSTKAQYYAPQAKLRRAFAVVAAVRTQEHPPWAPTCQCVSLRLVYVCAGNHAQSGQLSCWALCCTSVPQR